MRGFLLILVLIAPLSRGIAEEWQSIEVPGAWESQNEGRWADYDGFAWYRCWIEVPAEWEGKRLLLTVGRIDDVDEAWFNGDLVGANGSMPPLYGAPASDVRRPAVIEPDQVRFGEANLLAIRIFNRDGNGGIIEGPVYLETLDEAIDLAGRWDFIIGDQHRYGQAGEGEAREEWTLFKERHGSEAAGWRGVVPIDKADRERALAEIRGRFENNSNVHSQSEGKGEPLLPEEALSSFDVRSDFVMDLVAAEPDLTQPLYVEFDERGRMWVTEYIQYPVPAGLTILTWDQHMRAVFDAVPPPPPFEEGGKEKFRGRDKITVHEDRDEDGYRESATVFLEGLNLTTSTAQGHEGVWVLHPPYLLFYPDANGDDVPDADPVVHLSGFGLEDTHSIANSLKWGPDGWLYGATGSTVTARVKVEFAPERPPLAFMGQTIWRYHPEYHRFELFAEGGWNNFGVDFDAVGRLYSGTNGGMQAVHFVQGGFYQKSFGKHGPHTNPYAFDYFGGMPLEGDNRRMVHQWLPYGGGSMPGYEGDLFGVNPLSNFVTSIEMGAQGSTFTTREEEKTVETEDKWFRPVHVALGPDGGIYVSDFYDARITHLDPRDNWDREHGRVYRLRHRESEGYEAVDLGAMDSRALVDTLNHPNQWHRETARRLLAERKDAEVLPLLRRHLREAKGQLALESLWVLYRLEGLSREDVEVGLAHENPHVRVWTVRLLTDMEESLPETTLVSLVNRARIELHAEVVSQMAASAQRLPFEQGMALLEALIEGDRFTGDPFIPSQLWWGFEAQVARDPAAVVERLIADKALWDREHVRSKLAPYLVRRLVADPTPEHLKLAGRLTMAAPDVGLQKGMMNAMETGLTGITLSEVPDEMEAALGQVLKEGMDVDSVAFGMRLGSRAALETAERFVKDSTQKNEDRIAIIRRLAERDDEGSEKLFIRVIDSDPDTAVKQACLNALRRFSGVEVLAVLLEQANDRELGGTAQSVLAGRLEWSRALLQSVEDGDFPRERILQETLFLLKRFNDEAIDRMLTAGWGQLRQPAEEKAQRMEEIHALLEAGRGNAERGKEVFALSCAICHQLHGEGAKTGPDLTGYERDNRDFLITAIVDPNLAVREEYELVTIALRGRDDEPGSALAGFVKAINEASLTLVDLAGNETVVPRGEIVSRENAAISVMPDGLLDALEDQQIRDLFAYLQSRQDE